MNGDALQFEKRIVVDVIEVQQWKHAGIGAWSAETLIGFGAVQVPVEKFCRQAARPLIEVAEDDSRRLARDQFEQPVTLVATLKEARAQMCVEDFDRCLRVVGRLN